jgi:hypothetical protein
MKQAIGLCAVALAAHALLLLNDGIYWDDWLIYPQLAHGEWSSINALIHESGMTQVNAAFLDVFAVAPGGVFAFKLAVFVLICAMGLLIYAIGIEAGLTRLDSWLIAALAIVFPGFQDWVLLVTASSVFDVCLFLAATLLLVRAERAAPLRGLWMRIAAALLFLASFSLSSLLVLYLGALLLLLVLNLRRAGLGDVVRERWKLALGLLALPVAYWEASRLLYEPSGLYLGANSFVSTPSDVLRAMKNFAVRGVFDQLGQALLTLTSPWTLILIAVLAVALAAAWRLRRHPAAEDRRTAAGALVVGLVWLGLAILPYAAVGKYPSVHGWDTRHDVLVGLPLAVVIVSAVRLALPGGARALAGVGLLGVLGVALMSAGIQDYLNLQARWTTDRAVMAALARQPADGHYSVYWVSDGAPGPEDFYRFYEWSAMFGVAYGGESRVGLDGRAYDATFFGQSAFFNARYDLAGFDPRGCQADLVINRGDVNQSNAQTTLEYTMYRLFQPDRLNDYLNGLVTIQVVPHPSPLATDCPS